MNQINYLIDLNNSRKVGEKKISLFVIFLNQRLIQNWIIKKTNASI